MDNKFKTFPIQVPEAWLDRVGDAIRLTTDKSKAEFIIRAVTEKMDEVLNKK